MTVTLPHLRQVPVGPVPCRTGSGLRRLGRVMPELLRVRPVGFGARHDCGIRTLKVVA